MAHWEEVDEAAGLLLPSGWELWDGTLLLGTIRPLHDGSYRYATCAAAGLDQVQGVAPTLDMARLEIEALADDWGRSWRAES